VKTLTERDLPILNLILDRDPELARMLGTRLDALEAALTSPVVAVALGPEPAPGEAVTEPPGPTTAPSQEEPRLEERILDWFQKHPGKHKLAQVRRDLNVVPESKPFKTALHKLINGKKVKSTGARGRGAEYWLG
jgi:hypothetical protein